MSYNEMAISWGGETFIFVTRGRSKPFDAEEAVQYLTDRVQKIAESSNDVNCVVPDENLPSILDLEPEVVPPEFTPFIPNDKGRKLMFVKDYNMGVDFCAAKYGVTGAHVVAELKRLAPHMNVVG